MLYMKQSIEELIWAIIEKFYVSLQIFKKEYQQFGHKVQWSSQQNSIDSTWPQIVASLTVEQWMTLIGYDQIEELAENYIAGLLNLTKQLEMYGHTNSYDNNLQKKISELYYELSFLQNEGQHIRNHAYEYMETPNHDQVFIHELQQIKIIFPTKLAHISQLFDNIKNEIENLIQQHKETRIVIRSLYLFGEEIFNSNYIENFQQFITKIYPTDHLLELYIRATYSFLQSGFQKEAYLAYKKAKVLVSNMVAPNFSSESMGKLSELEQVCSTFSADIK